MTTKPVAAGMAKGLTVLASSRGVVLGLQLVTISLLAGPRGRSSSIRT